ncbi:serine/threonine-protein kinase [Nocardia cyriacigeorgica]|uniref:serine/threonine-protein kinase n=1 Tax=Nocardia cyriacigeorgica TaxID=135487 RepID=UPI002B4B21D2|nr:serine/threonine-protein kinase [Nocardia cyriacigeorgica]
MQPGSVFAGYQIERRLGRGGMGSVYLAKHPRLPRRTALKLLNPDLFDDKETRARFEREADLAAQLDHPNIVTVYDRGAEDGQLWISMQYIDGVDAASLDPNTLPVLRAVQIIADTAQALDFAHSMGVLHRDVKPANILLSTAHTGPERVYLTDFGIARLRDDGGHLTQNRVLHRHHRLRLTRTAHRGTAGSPHRSVFAGLQPVLAADRHRAVLRAASGGRHPGPPPASAAGLEQRPARTAHRARRGAGAGVGEAAR